MRLTQMTERDRVGLFLLFITGLLAVFAWRAFFLVMMTPGVDDLWQPLLWFSVLSIFFFLGTVVWKTAPLQGIGATLVFAPGFFFIPAWEYVVVSVLSLALLFWSARSILSECTERFHFRFFRSVRTGQWLFIIGLALSLSGGYYVLLRQVSWEELVPRFRVGEEMTGIIFRTAALVYPSFAALTEGDATVDEFLLSFEENNFDNPSVVEHSSVRSGGAADTLEIAPEVMESLALSGDSLDVPMSPETKKLLFLESGRKQVAELAGRPVQGDEKISAVLSVALQRKLIRFFEADQTTQHFPSQAVPFFLALLLFFTLLPLLSFLGILCILLAQVLFVVLLKLGWLALEHIPADQQKLAD